MIRQHKALEAQKVADTSDLSNKVNSGATIGSAGFAVASNAAQDLAAARTVARVTGPIGHLLDAATQTAGFKADRASGMPLDEALVKHAGGMVLGSILGAVGRGVGIAATPEVPPLAEFDGALLGEAGNYLGQDMAAGAAVGLHKTKGELKLVGRNISAMDNPSAWVSDPDRSLHSPFRDR